MIDTTPAEADVEAAVTGLLAARARIRSRGVTTLGGRVVLLGAGTPCGAAVAAALHRLGVHELTRDDAADAAELEAAWRSAHGVVDARATASDPSSASASASLTASASPTASASEPAPALPLDRALLPEGAWLVRAAAPGYHVSEI